MIEPGKYYMSLQYCNKSKSQLTTLTPAQLPAVAVSSGHIVYSLHCIYRLTISKVGVLRDSYNRFFNTV
jgi:hypothetical protein